MTKTLPLAALLVLTIGSAASAGIPTMTLPNLTWPEPVEAPTQGCANPATVTGPLCSPTDK